MMNRRSFVHQAGLATAVLAGARHPLHVQAANQPPTPAPLKNWIWTGLEERSTRDEQQRRLESYRESGIQAVLFSGVNEQVFAMAKEQGLETHAWTWTLCRGDRDLLEQHPDWYVVSRLGDSAATKPPYVGYYHFLCPSREEVGDYLARLFAKLADTPHLDGVHLDYNREDRVDRAGGEGRRHGAATSPSTVRGTVPAGPEDRSGIRRSGALRPGRGSQRGLAVRWAAKGQARRAGVGV